MTSNPTNLKDIFYSKLLYNFTQELANNGLSVEVDIADGLLKILHLSLKIALDNTFIDLESSIEKNR